LISLVSWLLGFALAHSLSLSLTSHPLCCCAPGESLGGGSGSKQRPKMRPLIFTSGVMIEYFHSPEKGLALAVGFYCGPRAEKE
jgi:hypothetical protein